MVGVEDILARLPKLRKDARANVESVLHELTADKNATIPLSQPLDGGAVPHHNRMALKYVKRFSL